MVASWLPDPPVGRSSDEISTISTPVIFVDSDTDDQEPNVGDENVLENEGYRLLNDHDNHVDDDHDDTEDETLNNVLSDSVQTMLDDVSTDDIASDVISNAISEHDQNESTDTRDIDVDYDQVRTVMARISLPASATPSWASTIPDSEWGTFLQNRMRTLQGRDEVNSESPNRQDCS